MGKGGLLKTLRAYKSTLLILALLLIIVFSIFNTQKRKIIEHNTNMNKKFLEITAFIDSSNNSPIRPTIHNDAIKEFDELKRKYIDYNNVIIKTHPIADYMPWLSIDKNWDNYLKKDKKTADSLSQAMTQLAPVVAISMLDKTNGDTPAKGAERVFLMNFHKASKPEDITAVIDKIPGFIGHFQIGQEPAAKK
jgi:hypothetical protein